MASKWNPLFKIDLRDLIDKAYPQDTADKLRPLISKSDFKQLFGIRVVDEIVYRTRELNINKKGKSLGTYSTAYKNSLIFDIYKGGDKQVNLTLTGEMLDTLNHRNGKYEIIVHLTGELNKAKAQGHITGRYGKKGRANSGDRDFLGLPDKEQVRIFKETVKDYQSDNLTIAAELGA
jgi:hypothetical protein